MPRLIRRVIRGFTREPDCVVEQSVGTTIAKSVFNPADRAKEHV
ncbi:hypothetical protein LMG28690_06688 [Paraburkholderia caffeinilytica]|nr:hypothetical protein LMG28690_06688 [Paraburkholderia caffeinilytica]